MDLRKIYFIFICILGLLIFYNSTYAQDESLSPRKLTIFYSPTCHKCFNVKEELMPDIERQFRNQIYIEYRDITDIENYKLLLGLKEKYRTKIELVLPVFFFEGKFLNAKDEIKNNLVTFIAASLNRPHPEAHLPAIDLVARFQSFELLAVVGAGLIDGINPCAFTVIVFFISFLALQGYRRRELVVIGLSFIFAVFLTYLLIGLGIFNFLYRLRGFLLITRIVNISIGLLCIILGILAIYDFFKFRRTGSTQGLFLQLPQAIKNRIHYIIGLHYRQPKEQKEQSVKPHIFRLLVSALITGFLISILEAVCTGQVYLPTITFVLKTSHLKLQALGYLLLYNLMFIVPLIIIFLFALSGATSEQFAKFLKKRLALIKILMSVLFFGFGIFLIWRP